MDYTERNQEIRRLRDEGKTFAEIGSMFGIDITRARRIYLDSVKEEKRTNDYKLMGRMPVRYFNALKRAGVDSDEKLIEMIEAGYDFSCIHRLGKNANHIIKFYYEKYKKEVEENEKK